MLYALKCVLCVIIITYAVLIYPLYRRKGKGYNGNLIAALLPPVSPRAEGGRRVC
jgi:hypothetical protein